MAEWAREQRVAAGRAGGTAAAAAHQAMGELLQIPGGTGFLPATFDELLQMATRVSAPCHSHQCVLVLIL